MAHTTFILQDIHATKPTSIYCFLTIGKGRRIKLNTRERIPVTAWHRARQRVKPTFTGSSEINLKLNQFEEKLLRLVRDSQIEDKRLDKALIEQLIWEEKTTQVPRKEFWESVEEFLEAAKITRSKNMMKVYKTSIRHLKDFEKKKRYKLTFENFNRRFYDKYLAYLVQDCQLNNNSAGKYIKTLKTFLNDAQERGHNTYTDFKRFKVLKEDSLAIALTQEELARLAALDLSQYPRIGNARDLFLLHCYTGLRFSDVLRIQEEHFSGDHLILKTIKTRDSLKIPLSSKAKAIIQKIIDGDIRRISNQKLNDYIKEAAKMAEIDDLISITTFSGSQRTDTAKPKYELISTHTGRRTFITLSLQRGMQREIVMRITGHKDSRSFEKYIKITDDTVDKVFLKAWEEK